MVDMKSSCGCLHFLWLIFNGSRIIFAQIYLGEVKSLTINQLEGEHTWKIRSDRLHSFQTPKSILNHYMKKEVFW